MKDVGYFAPTDVGEALELLSRYGEEATVLAGGTDLVPRINYYELKPANLIYVGGLGIDGVKEENDQLILGAGLTWSQIIENDVIVAKAPMLTDAAKQGGSEATRNAGTLGGNLCNASPAGDLSCALMALNAQVVLKSSGGERVVAIQDFFTGPGSTVRAANELLTEVHVPIPRGETAFLKLGRRKAMTLSVVSTGIQIIMSGSRCEEAAISLGAMAPTPLRCTRAEGSIRGKTLDAAVIADCAETTISESSPIDDQRATAWYRKKAGKALVAEAIRQAAGMNH